MKIWLLRYNTFRLQEAQSLECENLFVNYVKYIQENKVYIKEELLEFRSQRDTTQLALNVTVKEKI